MRPLICPKGLQNFIKSTLYRNAGDVLRLSLRKHAYSNILKILQPKKEYFQRKNSDIFHISPQNIDCGYSLEPPRRGGSNEYPQSMFFRKIRKIMYTPVNPSFTVQKWSLKGSKLYRRVFVMYEPSHLNLCCLVCRAGRFNVLSKIVGFQ